jgi:hypothetical protein
MSMNFQYHRIFTDGTFSITRRILNCWRQLRRSALTITLIKNGGVKPLKFMSSMAGLAMVAGLQAADLLASDHLHVRWHHSPQLL